MKRILAFVLLLGVDIFSKMVAIQWVPSLLGGAYPFGGIPIVEDFLGISFSFNYIVNTGAAWGVFAGHSGLLFLARFLIILALGAYLFFRKRSAFLWLILTGAIGNVLDYLLYGHVIDFFHFVFWGYSFPIFNCADAYITLGVLGLILFTKQERLLPAL